MHKLGFGYRCDICGSRYRHPASLKRHEKKHAKGREDEAEEEEEEEEEEELPSPSPSSV